MFIHLGNPTQYEDNIFTISYIETRPYEHFDNVQIAISLEMNLDRLYIDRAVYTALDFIGDVGGLQAALMIVFGILFTMSTVNAFDNWLV